MFSRQSLEEIDKNDIRKFQALRIADAQDELLAANKALQTFYIFLPTGQQVHALDF